MDHLSSLAEEVKNGLPGETTHGGYSFDFLGEVEDEYRCSICLDVLREPYQIVPCGHRCCRSCLGKLLRTQGNKASCPIDRDPISLSKIFPDNHCKRKILNMKIYCTQHDAGCPWQAELSTYENHVQSCPYALIPCSNEGCVTLIARKELDEHELNCEWRVIICDQCNDQIRAFEVKKHKRDSCPNENVPCSARCLMYVPRCQMEQHIESVCAEKQVQCPLKVFGCQTEGSRRDVLKHLELSKFSHLETLCTELGNMKMELDDLKTRIGCRPALNANPQVPAKDEFHHYIWNTPKLAELDPVLCGEIYSTPYSTGARGYCFTIAMLKRRNDTVFSIRLIPGIYDNLLPWPFRCDITIVLLDQQAERSHIKKYVELSSPDFIIPLCFRQPEEAQTQTTLYPMLTVLNDTLLESRYSPDGSAMIMVKVKSYNCEEHLGI